MEITSNIKDWLAFCGIVLIIFLLWIAVMIIVEEVKKLIIKARAAYIYNTRYKKKPTAACFCRDCERFDPETGACSDSCNLRYMNMYWFCCFATPLKDEALIERNKIINEKRFNGMKIMPLGESKLH